MKTHKVGQDIVFTKRQFTTISSNKKQGVSETGWFLIAITASYFLAQSLLLFII